MPKKYEVGGRNWTPEEDAFIQAHWLMPLWEQGKALGRTASQVEKRRYAILGKATMLLCDKVGSKHDNDKAKSRSVPRMVEQYIMICRERSRERSRRRR